MSYLPSSLLLDLHLNKSSKKAYQSQRQLMMSDQKKASNQRTLRESIRPKMVLYDRSREELPPCSYYIKQAREKYLKKTQLSKSTQQRSMERTHSERKVRLRSKLVPMNKSPEPQSVYPDWLLNKPSFKTMSPISSTGIRVDLIVQIPESLRTEKQHEHLLNWLVQVKYFKSLPKLIVSDVCKKLAYQEHSKGSTLISMGQEADYLFVVYSGKVGVYIEGCLLYTSPSPRDS